MVKRIIRIFSTVLCIGMCLVLPEIARAEENTENEPAVISGSVTEESGIYSENIDETTGAEDLSAPESDVNTETYEGQGLGAGEGLGAPEPEVQAAPSAQSVTMVMNGTDDPGFTVTVSGL